MMRIAMLVLALTALFGCSEKPEIAMARTKPLDEVIRTVYENILSFNPNNAFDMTAAALERTDIEPADRQKLRFAQALALENYRPKSDENIEKARAIFYDVAEKSADMAPRALLHVGRAYEVHLVEPEPDAARDVYRKLLADYPGSDVEGEATLRLGLNLIWRESERDRNEGEALLIAYLGKRPDSDTAAALWLALADVYVARKRFREAADALVAAYDAGIVPVRRRIRALYQIANMAYLELKDYKLAEKYYRKAVDEYPNWNGNYEARLRLKAIREGRAGKETSDSGKDG